MKILLFITLGLIVIACSNESLFKTGEKELSSITRTMYSVDKNGNASNTTATLTFQGKEIKDIRYDGLYSETFEYLDGSISKRRKFDLNKTPVSTVNYSYDNLGRITKIESQIGDKLISNETNYNDDTRQINSVWKNVPGHIIYERYVLTANQEGQISQEAVRLSDNSILYYGSYEYSVNNLASCKIKVLPNDLNQKGDSINFKYLDKKNTGYYKKFMFGKQWKINASIENAVNFSPFVTSRWEDLLSIYPMISENLISEYSTKEVSVSFSYTFDDQGDVTMQIEQRTYANGGSERIITNYVYSAQLISTK